MNDMYHNLTSFLAIWFRNLQKSTYNVNVVNKEVDKISPLLYEKLQAIQFLLQDLQGKELKVKVSNQKELNTKDLEDKLTALLSGVKGINLDTGTVEKLLSDLISLSKGIKKVEVLNHPVMPDKMSVSGKVEVLNLPKVQEVKGDFNLKESRDILNALKELATEIRDLKLESIQGYKNMGSTFIGTTGSREAHKLTDGTKTATITTSGNSNALDVNIVAGGAGNGAILDGVDSDIKATVKDLTNANPLTVAIVDTSGDQIASFGGGTQYTEGDTDTTIVGTAIMWEDAGNALTPVSSSKPLPVSASIDPTGLATSAKQDTIIGHVDGIEGLLTTIDADTSNISTKIDTIAGDTTSIQTAVELIDDAVYTDGTGTVTKGIAILGQDGTNPQAIKTDANGELQVDVLTMPTVAVTNAGITTIAGAVSGTEMQVDIVTSALPTGASTLAEQQSQTTHLATIAGDTTAIETATQLIDDMIYVDDADWTDSTSKHALVGGLYQSTPQTVTDGDVAPFNITANGALHVSDAGGSLTVDGTVAVTNSDITSIKTAVEILDNAISGSEMQVDVLTIAAGDNNIGNVDVVTLPALAAGTNAIGKLLAPDIDVTAHTNYIKKYYTNAGAATDGIVWSPAAGKRWHAVVIHFQVSADCTVTLEDDKAAGDEVVWKGEYKAGSGHTLTFTEKYPLASGEDAADLLITTSAGNIYLLAVGYEI